MSADNFHAAIAKRNPTPNADERLLLRAVAFGWAEKEQSKTWPSIYTGQTYDRKTGVSASEYTDCPRKLAFAKRSDVAPSGAIEVEWAGVAERGNSVEAWLVDALASGLPNNCLFYGHSWLQRTFAIERRVEDGKPASLKIAGTPDGILDIYDGPTDAKSSVLLRRIVLEFKSVDPRANLRGSGFPRAKHVAQVQLNAALVSHIAAFIPNSLLEFPVSNHFDGEARKIDYVISRTSCAIVYINSNDVSDIRVCTGQDVPFDNTIYGSVIRRATVTAAAVFCTTDDPSKVVATGHANGECTFCPYTAACEFGPKATPYRPATRDEAPVIPAIGNDAFKVGFFGGVRGNPAPFVTSDTPEPRPAPPPPVKPAAPVGASEGPPPEHSDLRDLVLATARAKQASKEADTEYDALSSQLKSEMIKREITDFVTSDVSAGVNVLASIQTVKGRRTLDVDAYVAATGVPADDYYKTGAQSVRLEFKIQPL